jgi:hypothetical protein
MREWIKSPEESIISLQTLSRNTKIDRDNHGEDIGVAKLTNAIKKKLKEERITHGRFAKVVLGISFRCFNSMQSRSTPFAQCHSQTKELYRKMHEWIKSPEESIKSMKKLTNAVKVLPRKFEDEVEIDPFDLVNRVNQLVASWKITKTKLSMMLDLADSVFNNLMLHPTHWHLMNKVGKNYYTKIHAWLIQNENESDESFEKSSFENDLTDAINTAQVASEFVQLLKNNGILQGYVACRKLKIVKSYFNKLVNFPKPYAELKESERKIFQCMKKWTEPSEVENLKRGFDSYAPYFKKNQLNNLEAIKM